MCDCNIREVNECWNLGFESYTKEFNIPYHYEINDFISKLSHDHYDVEKSVVAFSKKTNQAIGVAASGIKELGQGDTKIKTGWVGSAAVVPGFRSMGVARKLMAVTLELLKIDGVEVANLEVVVENKGALKCYQNLGFVQTGLFIYMEKIGLLPGDAFSLGNMDVSTKLSQIEFKSVSPLEISRIDFYNHQSAWQSQWFCFQSDGGQGIILQDKHSLEILGYALYKLKFDENNSNINSIELYNITCKPGHPNYEFIIKSLLNHVLRPGLDTFRDVYTPPSPFNDCIIKLLTENGFKKCVDLTWMSISLNSKNK
eukprot:gene3915-4888_t